MALDIEFLSRCIGALQSAHDSLQGREPDDEFYEVFRAAAVKEFEIVLEQSGNLLRKRLRTFMASHRQADQLTFKDIFRHAARHGLITLDTAERWCVYRDNRNDTAHNYGAGFAEATLAILPGFIQDARDLAGVIAEGSDD
ncbi:MAG: nucleotidyltransferase substrate binding protein [Chloroflexi bacterium]|nr:nucleotidyltransferase substrate binding protein [Chloroflexota bacterium]